MSSALAGLVLVLGAALAGSLFRVLAGWLAVRRGHSRGAAEKAVATSGLSLIVKRKDKSDDEDHLSARV